jgi:hypothetical protein
MNIIAAAQNLDKFAMHPQNPNTFIKILNKILMVIVNQITP